MISIPSLRAELRLPLDRDDQLATLLAQCVAQFESETGRPWAARADHVQTFSTPGDATVLYPELLPITDVSLVQERGVDDSTWETVESDAYLVDGPRIERVDGAPWARRVRVTYDGGYADDTCPGDVRAALVAQARFVLKRHTDGLIAVRSQNFEGGAGVFEDADAHPYFRRIALSRRRRV